MLVSNHGSQEIVSLFLEREKMVVEGGFKKLSAKDLLEIVLLKFRKILKHRFPFMYEISSLIERACFMDVPSLLVERNQSIIKIFFNWAITGLLLFTI